ncbi:MAG: cell division protein FtsQ/DivIB [Longimicrobiales bacterium]
MRRSLGPVLVLALAASLAWAMARIPEALSRVEAFRIREIRLEGNRFLSPEEAAKSVAISPLASIWDDFDILEERLRTHPLVEDVQAKRRFPGTLLLEVRERQPVALVPNPTLEPVDDSGRILPIDPSRHQLDLPIISRKWKAGGDVLSAAERRLLVGELIRLAQGEPDLLARISEIALDPRGDLWVQFWRRDVQGEVWDLPVTLRFHPSPPSRRVQEGLRVLSDAMNRFEGAVVADLDLRYEDQVVVRLDRAQGN